MRARIAISGSAGVGKSTLARRLAADLGWPYVPEGMREYLESGAPSLHDLGPRGVRDLVLRLWEERKEAEARAGDAFVADRASYDFGALVLATTDNLSSSATVTNDGNIVSTWALRVSANDGVWTAATGVQVPAADRYKLMALFDDPTVGGAPVTANFDTTNDVLVSAGPGLGTLSSATNYAGDQSGEAVTVGATRGLWFRLDMPTSSSVSTQRSFTVEIEAQERPAVPEGVARNPKRHRAGAETRAFPAPAAERRRTEQRPEARRRGE